MTHPMTACEWRVGPPGLDEIRIVERGQRNGSVLFAVTQRGWVANTDHEWEYEPIPSNRDRDFMARCRWANWEDAALVAQRMYEIEKPAPDDPHNPISRPKADDERV
jgi:hypothetical protein